VLADAEELTEPVEAAELEVEGLVAVALAPLDEGTLNVVLATEETPVVGPWAIENEPLVAKTSLMLPILTALREYPEVAGTMGHSRVSGLRLVGSRLLARASEFWKEGWFNSRVKEGSEPSAVQVMFETRPEVTFVGVSKTIVPKAAGRAAARMRNLENILRSR